MKEEEEFKECQESIGMMIAKLGTKFSNHRAYKEEDFEALAEKIQEALAMAGGFGAAMFMRDLDNLYAAGEEKPSDRWNKWNAKVNKCQTN